MTPSQRLTAAIDALARDFEWGPDECPVPVSEDLGELLTELTETRSAWESAVHDQRYRVSADMAAEYLAAEADAVRDRIARHLAAHGPDCEATALAREAQARAAAVRDRIVRRYPDDGSRPAAAAHTGQPLALAGGAR